MTDISTRHWDPGRASSAAGMALDVGFATDVGRVRERNEDYFMVAVVPQGALFVVADGMGGHLGGQRASQLTCEAMFDDMNNQPADAAPDLALERAVLHANERVHTEGKENPELNNMGATVVALLFARGHIYRVHAGDSRHYMFRRRQGALYQMSVDHTMVQEMVQSGILTPEQAKKHPNANVVRRAVGPQIDLEPEVDRARKLHPDERHMMCSDGLYDMVGEERIADILMNAPDAQTAAESLVQEAVENGGMDNVTVVVIDTPQGPDTVAGGEISPWVAVGVALMTLMMLVAAFLAWRTFLQQLQAPGPLKDGARLVMGADGFAPVAVGGAKENPDRYKVEVEHKPLSDGGVFRTRVRARAGFHVGMAGRDTAAHAPVVTFSGPPDTTLEAPRPVPAAAAGNNAVAFDVIYRGGAGWAGEWSVEVRFWLCGGSGGCVEEMERLTLRVREPSHVVEPEAPLPGETLPGSSEPDRPAVPPAGPPDESSAPKPPPQ